MKPATELPISQFQLEISQQLKAGGIDNCGLEARFLLAHVLKIELSDLLVRGADSLSLDHQEKAWSLVKQRISGVPLHRLFGYREFYGRKIEFGEGCLEPRPETELLVERVLKDWQSSDGIHFAEIGVGSGAIVTTLLLEMSGATALGTDISGDAIDWTNHNANSFGVQDRLQLMETDCLFGVDRKFDFIVSNPPYIRTGDLDALSGEVTAHDPMAALDGGADGLKIYRKILEQSRKHLSADGMLYLETGHGQHAELEQLADELGWGIVSKHLDLSDLERIVVLQ